MIDIRQKYNPTPHEIAAKCREIQAGWTDSERMQRMRFDKRPFDWNTETAHGQPVEPGNAEAVGAPI